MLAQADEYFGRAQRGAFQMALVLLASSYIFAPALGIRVAGREPLAQVDPSAGSSGAASLVSLSGFAADALAASRQTHVEVDENRSLLDWQISASELEVARAALKEAEAHHRSAQVERAYWEDKFACYRRLADAVIPLAEVKNAQRQLKIAQEDETRQLAAVERAQAVVHQASLKVSYCETVLHHAANGTSTAALPQANEVRCLTASALGADDGRLVD
jgi:hypothetical protein